MTAIAILGASSQIAKDLILSMAAEPGADLLLYVRNLAPTRQWLLANGLDFRCKTYVYADYGKIDHDAVLNFVGVGDPQRAADMGGSIFGITCEFDELVIRNLISNRKRRYIFLSSGAAYGSTFLEPATVDTRSVISINDLKPQEYYAVAKLHAEARHRSLSDLAITDIRVFNYFSRTQSLDARFFISDIVRTIRDGVLLRTSPDFMVRDFLHPADFHTLVKCILGSPARNGSLDCYTRAPVDKPTLLQTMQDELGLRYEVEGSAASVNATGQKPHYYSLNRTAAEYGYEPAYSSLEGIIAETRAILQRPDPRGAKN